VSSKTLSAPEYTLGARVKHGKAQSTPGANAYAHSYEHTSTLRRTQPTPTGFGTASSRPEVLERGPPLKGQYGSLLPRGTVSSFATDAPSNVNRGKTFGGPRCRSRYNEATHASGEATQELGKASPGPGAAASPLKGIEMGKSQAYSLRSRAASGSSLKMPGPDAYSPTTVYWNGHRSLGRQLTSSSSFPNLASSQLLPSL